MTLKKSIKSYIWFLMFVLLAGSGIGAVYVYRSNIVAKVNGVTITKSDLNKFLLQQGGEEALNSLIQKSIIKQEAKKQNVQVTVADVEKELSKVKESLGSDDAFNQALGSNGTTLDDLKDNLLTTIEVKRILEAKKPITDEEIKIYFELNKASLSVAEEVKARHILVETEEQAKEVQTKIAAGEDFAQLAKQYSTDAGTKELGGDLGFFKTGEMVKEFDDVAFSLEVGKVSETVKTDFGYHIIKVEDKKVAKEANLEESKARIVDALLQQKMDEEYSTWFQERLADYDIKNYLFER